MWCPLAEHRLWTLIVNQVLEERTSSPARWKKRWFRELTDKALRRGSFNSVPDLIAAIDYLAAHNDDPKPFK
jgi:hypothetical protein